MVSPKEKCKYNILSTGHDEVSGCTGKDTWRPYKRTQWRVGWYSQRCRKWILNLYYCSRHHCCHLFHCRTMVCIFRKHSTPFNSTSIVLSCLPSCSSKCVMNGKYIHYNCNEINETILFIKIAQKHLFISLTGILEEFTIWSATLSDMPECPVTNPKNLLSRRRKLNYYFMR